MSTSSATEAARQRNGQFGTQVRTEAPLPTWDAALAHAEVLRERGVDVQIGEKWKWKWIARYRSTEPTAGGAQPLCAFTDWHFVAPRAAFDDTRTRAQKTKKHS